MRKKGKAKRKQNSKMSRAPGPSTLRKQLQPKVSDFETHFKAFMDNSPMLSFIKDKEGRYVYMNEQYLRLFKGGYKQFIGKTDFAAFPEAAARACRESDAVVWSTGKSHKTIESAPLADGSMRQWMVLKFPIQEQDGKEFLGGLALDVTEQRHAEIELEKSLSLLRATLESTTDGILVVDMKGHILSFNRKFVEMWGIPESIIMSRDDDRALSFVLEQLCEPQAFLKKVRELYSKPEAESFDVLHFKNGQIFERYSQPQFIAGQSVGRVWSFRDVSERHKAEESLKESEERYREIFENAHDLIQSVSPDGRVLYANRAWMETLGYCEADLDSLSLFDVVHPDSIAHCQEMFRRAMQGELISQVSTVFLTKDKRPISLEGNITTKFVDGKAVFARCILRDVTGNKKLEENLRQSQKMEALGKLAGGVAHDFNNLLLAIMGYSELLMLRLPEGDPLHKEVEEIWKAGKRAAVLTNQLLTFSRRQVLQPRVLDLNTEVIDMNKMLRRLIGENIELETKTAPELGHVRADPGQIEQAIMNFAVNARDAMPHGGKLILQTFNSDLRVSLIHEHGEIPAGRYVVLAVVDNGCGMSPDTCEHIFEPFFTTKELGKGTGLGLSTVFGNITQNEGYIRVLTEPGKGSTFEVYLPRIESASEDVTPKPVTPKPSHGSETVLLVEDESSVRDLVHEVLKKQGYRVLVACDGEQAIALADGFRDPIHLMVTDIVMPKMGGYEAAERLGASRPGMRVLYMSGHIDDAVMRVGMMTSEIPFLQKPFTVSALSAKVREVLGAVIPQP